MSSPFASLDALLRRLPDPVLLAIGLAIIAGLTVLGMRPDHGMPLDDLFFIPVAAVGWLARSRGYGYAAHAARARAGGAHRSAHRSGQRACHPRHGPDRGQHSQRYQHELSLAYLDIAIHVPENGPEEARALVD